MSFRRTPICLAPVVAVLLAYPALPSAAAEAKKTIPFTVPVSGMRLEPELRNQVSGLALTVEDAGWPALCMLGHTFGTLGELAQLQPGAGLKIVPFQFGAVRQEGVGRLVDQQVNDVSNAMTFRNGKGESVKVTVTRLSPAILLETTGQELELFGGADKLTPERNSATPPPLGTMKPLRWATPDAGGKVITGVLGEPASAPVRQEAFYGGVIPAPSLAPEKGSRPPVDGLGRTWLLLWYGSGSRFLSSKIPAVLGGTGFHEQPRIQTTFQADVPFLLVFDSSPQSVELRQVGNIPRLVVTFSGPTGKVAMLPIFGHDVQAAATTEKWLQEFPAGLKARCDDWANRLGDFPVNVKEETAYDEKADRVACAETFQYVKVRSAGKRMALVRPMLALGLQQKLPAVVTPQPVDLKYATQFGPLLAIAGERVEWHLDGLGKYVYGRPVIGPATEESKVLEKELSAEVDRVLAAGHLAPWTLRGAWFGCSHSTTYGKDPSDVLYFLSDILPVLPEAQQAKVRAYLAREAAAYPPDKVLQLKVTEGVHREFFSAAEKYYRGFNWPLGKEHDSDEYYEDAPSLFRAYGVSRYYLSTKRKPARASLEFWRRAMRESLAGRDWATLGWFWGKYAVHQPCWGRDVDYRFDYPQSTPRAIHRDAAGLIGYLRLCRLANEKGDPEAWGQLARLSMSRFALARYGRYLARAGLFRMPENPAAARWLALSGDFSKAENHCEQVWEVNQHEVAIYSGALRRTEYYVGFVCQPYYDCNHQLVFSQLTPELGRLLADWGLKDDVARCVKRYAEVQPVWYKSHSDSEHLHIGELPSVLASDSYQYFTAHAWIAGTPPEELERYVDEPWVAVGDFFFLHKLAETIKAYRGVQWKAEER